MSRSPRHWAVWQLPRPARALVVAVPMAYLIVVTIGAWSVHLQLRDVVIAAVFAMASVASVEVSMRLAWPRARGALISSDGLSVWILPVALLLPPLYVALMVLVPRVYVHLRVWRAQPMKFVYSTAVLGIAYFAASALRASLGGTSSNAVSVNNLIGSSQAVFAVAVAIAVWWLGQNLLVCAVVGLTAGRNAVNAFVRNVEIHAIDLVASCLGVATAVLWAVHPVAAMLLVPPVLLMQHQLYSGLRQAVRRDLLTDVSNPQFWREAASREVDRAWASGANLAVLVIDLDHFKDVNDRYGHLAGDDVLAAAARSIATALRPTDLVGRLGGEEFGAVLSGLGLDAAERAAERVRAQICRTRVRSDRGDWITVTASIGVAELSVNGTSLNELVAAADSAMYAAKAAGRDTVLVAPAAPPARQRSIH